MTLCDKYQVGDIVTVNKDQEHRFAGFAYDHMFVNSSSNYLVLEIGLGEKVPFFDGTVLEVPPNFHSMKLLDLSNNRVVCYFVLSHISDIDDFLVVSHA